MDSITGHDPGRKTLVGSGVTLRPVTEGSYAAQTLNGSQRMKSHNSEGALPAEGSTATGGGGGSDTAPPVTVVSVGPEMSKGLASAIKPPSSNSVIHTPGVNSPSVVNPPPVHTAAVVAGSATSQAGVAVQAPHVNSSQPANTVSISAAPRIIKAEPPTCIGLSAPQPAGTPSGPSAPRPPVTVAVGAGGILPPTPQMLGPRTPQATPGQPSLRNSQLPPGMVLVRSESGQLLLIPQQALAQMQAQAQAQAQGGIAPRAAAPTNVPPGQAPGNTISSRQVAPAAIIHQGCPAPASLAVATSLHAPNLQSSVGASGLTPSIVGQTAGTTVTPITLSKETIEDVKKCKSFLSTLIKLASNGKQSTETAVSVRELVKDLLEGKLEAEEFTSKLYKELNPSPRPPLVPFLKRNLPALRQLTPDSAAFIRQSQLPQPPSAPVSSSPPPQSTVLLNSLPPQLTVPVSRPQLQQGVTKPGQSSMVLQRPMLRPQVTVPTTPTMTLRNPAPGHVMLGQQRVQLKELPPVPVRPEVLPVSKQVGAAAFAPALKNKLAKDASGTFKDDDDINDVASMAGVNLSEESANILATSSGMVGAVTRSCKDETFLTCAVLQRRMLEISRRFGVTDLGPDVASYVSHATQHKLRNLLEKVSQLAQQKNIGFKEDDNFEQSSEVRAQLKFFEQLDQMEKQRKEDQEREILLKAAKSRARQEDPEQLRLKQKAKEMQQQELAQMRHREANLTALAAIGPRKKRKILDSPSCSAAAEGSGPSLSGGASSSNSRPSRQRIRRVNLRDLLFCLENERFASRSHFLYKGLLK